MKLQPASRKEVRRIALGSFLCAAAEIAGFFLLSLFDVVIFRYPMIIGAIGGTLVAIANFTLMCLMVQNAAGIQDQKLLRAKVQGSYNLRLLFQAGWIIAAFFIPWINVVTAAIPLVFPNLVIYYLQVTGKLMPSDAAPKTASDSETVSEELPDEPGPFEV